MAPIGAPLRDCRRELDVQLAGSMLVNLERREVIRLGGIRQSVHRRLPIPMPPGRLRSDAAPHRS